MSVQRFDMRMRKSCVQNADFSAEKKEDYLIGNSFMNLNLQIMEKSDAPIYKQVFDSIAAQILCGSLPGGTCLPPIRTIAAQLGISVITIKRAWEELERSGLITTNVGRGCFVAQLTEQKRDEMRRKIAQDELKKMMPLFRSLGLTAEDVMLIIKNEYSR